MAKETVPRLEEGEAVCEVFYAEDEDSHRAGEKGKIAGFATSPVSTGTRNRIARNPSFRISGQIHHDSLCYPNSFSYISCSKPTMTVLPLTSVGARRFPVGPNISFVICSSSRVSFFKSTSTTFFPLAANSLFAAPRSCLAFSS